MATVADDALNGQAVNRMLGAGADIAQAFQQTIVRMNNEYSAAPRSSAARVHENERATVDLQRRDGTERQRSPAPGRDPQQSIRCRAASEWKRTRATGQLPRLLSIRRNTVPRCTA